MLELEGIFWHLVKPQLLMHLRVKTPSPEKLNDLLARPGWGHAWGEVPSLQGPRPFSAAGSRPAPGAPGPSASLSGAV